MGHTNEVLVTWIGERRSGGAFAASLSARLLAGGAAVALVAIGMGACSTHAAEEDLFGNPGSPSGAGGEGAGGGAAGGGSPVSVSSASSSSSSAASSSSSGSGSGSGGDGGGDGGGTGGMTSAGSGGAGGSMSMCGNGACDPGETTASCPDDCPAGPCEHVVCATGDKLALGCDPCVDTVCGSDPFCCEMQWDGQCVNEAKSLCGVMCCGDGQCIDENCESCPMDCGVCPVDPTCAHSVCTAAGPLSTSGCHDPCISTVCAMKPSCCEGSPPMWDGACTTLAVACGPDPCVQSVCDQMPTCCTDEWSSACVDLAETSCNTPCDCPHSVCEQGVKLDPACDPCAAALCAADAYCCDAEWDGWCVGEVSSICGTVCE